MFVSDKEALLAVVFAGESNGDGRRL